LPKDWLSFEVATWRPWLGGRDIVTVPEGCQVVVVVFAVADDYAGMYQ